jgi:hypothetical protein
VNKCKITPNYLEFIFYSDIQDHGDPDEYLRDVYKLTNPREINEQNQKLSPIYKGRYLLLRRKVIVPE